MSLCCRGLRGKNVPSMYAKRTAWASARKQYGDNYAAVMGAVKKMAANYAKGRREDNPTAAPPARKVPPVGHTFPQAAGNRAIGLAEMK